MNAAWDRAFPNMLHDAAGRRVHVGMRFGLKAVTTPPWAQDIGSGSASDAIVDLLEQHPAALVVLDLAPGQVAPAPLPQGSWVLERHTRQCILDGNDPVAHWPAHRRKQLRRAEREGMKVESSKDTALMTELHQAARHRKGLKSDEASLRRLLEAVLDEPDTAGWLVKDNHDTPLAGGVFHTAPDGRVIYGFGGQVRREEPGLSSRGSVLLIAQAMRHASHSGAKVFDFGGSMDPGVDRFYAEFGAHSVAKVRLVQAAWPWRALLRWQRPDLFR